MSNINLNKIITEQVNKNTLNIDSVNTLTMLKMINDEDAKIAKAVKLALPSIAKAVDVITQSIKTNHRLIYIGTGTSGRLGVLDASEMPPTFSVAKNVVVGVIAGGNKALQNPIEGAEDNEQAAIKDLKKIAFSKGDVLVGISASGRTPYVCSGLKYANKIGAKTISLSTNQNAEISKIAKINIEVVVGPEVITGSTRMKSGTAQKLVLNMLSTGAMIKLGRTYGNLMVDLRPTNRKLIKRAHNLVKKLTNAHDQRINDVMKITKNEVKPAIVMILKDVNYTTAIKLLKANDNFIGRIIKKNNAIK
jgi:N-acetylmuramic acid 6-phosphate etherase